MANSPDWASIIQAIAAIVGAAVTCALVVITNKQVRLVQRTLEANKLSADAAMRSAAVTEKTQRPWVTIRVIDVNDSFRRIAEQYGVAKPRHYTEAGKEELRKDIAEHIRSLGVPEVTYVIGNYGMMPAFLRTTALELMFDSSSHPKRNPIHPYDAQRNETLVLLPGHESEPRTVTFWKVFTGEAPAVFRLFCAIAYTGILTEDDHKTVFSWRYNTMTFPMRGFVIDNAWKSEYT
jgi:hypothetical protein